jgi:predicted nucleic-acid-binding protein
MDHASEADQPLLISAVSLVELVYLREKGTFAEADLESFYEILDVADSAFEVAPLDGAVARAVSRIPRVAITIRSTG